MGKKIKNRSELLSHGHRHSRQTVLDITDAALEELDAYGRIRSFLKCEGNLLRIGDRCWDLDRKRNVYLIGAGKACNAMAMAVEDALGERLTDGIAVVKILEPGDRFVRTRVRIGGHPIPNQAGYEACLEILDLIDRAGPEDAFLCVMSGGSSALMSCPVDGISLEDEQKTTDILLKSGAGILEINAVRRHISRMNGGRMAQRIADRGAELIGFNISDSVSNPPTRDISIPWEHYYGTPMGPDQTTLQDALACIEKYNLHSRLPGVRNPVSRLLWPCRRDTQGLSPKYILSNQHLAGQRCGRTARSGTAGPARGGALYLHRGRGQGYGDAHGLHRQRNTGLSPPGAAPCALISVGESVTTISEDCVITGHGGPSQEMALSFAVSATKTRGACLLSIDTEGTDGTTVCAGGITDSDSLADMERAGVDIYGALRGHASFEALSAAGCVVMTGNTGTNLCDLNIMYVPVPEKEEEK